MAIVNNDLPIEEPIDTAAVVARNGELEAIARYYVGDDLDGVMDKTVTYTRDGVVKFAPTEEMLIVDTDGETEVVEVIDEGASVPASPADATLEAAVAVTTPPVTSPNAIAAPTILPSTPKPVLPRHVAAGRAATAPTLPDVADMPRDEFNELLARAAGAL